MTRVLSVAAGVPSVRLEAALGGEPAVVRAMPNMPALVGAGVTAISGGSFATSHDLAWAEDVLSAVGTVVRLPERLLDAVTGLSGSGPAYFFLVAEALIEAGVQMGLTREVSRTLVVGTMHGSAALLRETGRDPESLRAEVTSPAGTTAAGIRTLESRAVRSAFMEAVAAATGAVPQPAALSGAHDARARDRLLPLRLRHAGRVRRGRPRRHRRRARRGRRSST